MDRAFAMGCNPTMDWRKRSPKTDPAERCISSHGQNFFLHWSCQLRARGTGIAPNQLSNTPEKFLGQSWRDQKPHGHYGNRSRRFPSWTKTSPPLARLSSNCGLPCQPIDPNRRSDCVLQPAARADRLFAQHFRNNKNYNCAAKPSA